jgi:hypothetical protein
MSNLELKDGTPYNIVQIDGRWYFADGLFAQDGSTSAANAIPKDLRLVPDNLIPAIGVKRGGKTYSYVPESRIKEYFTSAKYEKVLQNVSDPRVPASALKVLTTTRVANNIATVNEKDRSRRWTSVDKIPTSKDNATVGVQDPRWQQSVGFDWAATYGKNNVPTASPWDYLTTSNQKDSLVNYDTLSGESNIVQKQGVNWLLLADDTGALSDKGAIEERTFRMSLSASPANLVKENQMLLKRAGYLDGSYVATGAADEAYLNAMLTIAREVSFKNLSTYNAGQGANPAISLSEVKPLSLDEYLKSLAKGADSAPRAGSTSTSTDIFQLSDGDARALLENFYAEAVGRRPSDKEVKSFKIAVENQARKKPTVSTSRTTYDVDGNANTTSSSKQGFNRSDAELMGRDTAEADPRANAFLTSTKYFDAFVSALRGPLG